MFPDFFPKKMTAWVLIFMQLCMPVTGMLPLLTHAAAPSEAQVTVQGLNALIMGDPGEVSSPSPEHTSGFNEKAKIPYSAPLSLPDAKPEAGLPLSSGWDISRLPDLSPPADKSAGAQPHKAGSEAPKADPDADASAYLASGATQAGTLLSSDNATDASINYAKGVGEGLINQQINDWLKQFGNAKVSLGSDKKVSGDMLIPLYDTERDLLFTQVGVRTGQERNTANLGFGYRQYLSDWMLGVNTFYDYDYTGKNKRLGAGAEAWRDYLKLAVNGYYRLTDWHQSVLSAMKDYDERPANGFDLRAEGYLPAWPNLGGTLKYEQYFGKGVSLSNSASVDSLKNNPKALTAGVTYTPFPLMTLSAARSVGDTNDTRLGLDLNYRLGVPWYRQVSPDSVDLMRSLAGSKYDFVDRNYEIVMQYRKQELLTISLPAATTAQAAETVPVVLTVSKAKYGLKSVNWNVDATLTARGGRYRQVSPTELRVTLPAYVFGQQTNGAQNYKISAVATDNNGNQSNTAEMWMNVIPSVETITKLTVTPNQSLLANNSDQFTAVAMLQNDKGEVLANKAVTFSVSGLKNSEGVTIYDADGNSGQTLTVISKPDGTATVKIISKSAGKGLLKAKMRNGNSRTESIVYVADISTAKIKTLELTNNKAVADGQANNIAVATVTDQFDNQVENFPLTSRADNGATVTAPNHQTDTNGQVTIRFSSETAGDSKLMVEGTGTSKSVIAQFVADISTAKIQSAVVTQDGAKADGKARNEVLVTVTDSRNNPLAGAPVIIKVQGTARYQTQPVSGLTDSRGQVRISISNTKAGSDNYTFSINGDDAVRALKFVADETTASITDASLVLVTNNQKADGAAANSVKATIVDAYNNPVPAIAVQFVTDHGALPSQMQINTDAHGHALFELTNTRAGNTKVTVQVNTKSASKTVMFTADSTTAEILASNLTITADNSAADGRSVNSVKALVTDAQGNVLPYVAVLFTADNGASPASHSLLTNEQGEVTFSITSTRAAQVAVKAKINSSEPSVTVTFKADSANPDAQKSSLTADPVTLVADGQTTSTLHFILKDRQGNLIPGQTVVFGTALAGTTVSGTTENPDGTYTATLKGVKAGDAKVSITLNGKAFAVTPTTVKLTADSGNLDKDKSLLTAAPLSIVADGTTESALKLTLKDANGNLVAGQTVLFSTTLANTTFGTVKDNQDGTYTATLKGKTAGPAEINVSVGGNALAVAPVTVTLTPDTSKLDKDKSLLTAVPDTIVADGNTTSAITLTLRDVNNNPVAGQTALFSTGLQGTTFSTVTDNQDGTYTATLKGKTAGPAEINVSVGGNALAVAPVTVTLTPDTSKLDKDKSLLTAAPLSIVADGTTESALKLTLKDANGNLVAGQTVLFSTTLANTTFGTVKDNQDGTYTATLKGKTAGPAEINVSVGGNALAVAPVTVTLTPDTSKLDKDKSLLTAVPDTIVADGNTTSAITLTLRDVNNNPVAGQTALFSTGLQGTTFSTVTDNQDGTYTATLKGKTAGPAEINVSVGGNALAVAPVTVTLTPDTSKLDKDKSLLTAAPLSIVADGTTESALKLTLKDANGNLVAGQTVLFSTTLANTTFGTVKDNQDGTYTATLKGKTAGPAEINVSVGGNALAVAPVTVTLTPDTSKLDKDKSLLTAAPLSIVADGTTESALKLTLKDANGNLVAGQTVLFSTTLANTTFGTVKDNQDGTYTATLKGKTAGPAEINVSVGGNALAVAPVTVTLTPDTSKLDKDKSLLTAAPLSIVADGTTESALKLTLKDANGNLVAGQTVLFSTTLANITFGTVKDNQDGTYTATLKGKTAGPAEINVSVGGNALAVAPVTVTLTPDTSKLDKDKSLLTAAPLSIVADGTTESALKLTLKDANGNLVAGQTVLFSTTLANTTFGTVKDNQDGTYTATLKGKTAGDAPLTVTVNGTTLPIAGVTVSLTSDAATATITSMKLNGALTRKIANGTNSFEFIAEVRDVNGNPVSGVTINWTSTAGASAKLSATSQQTDAEGNATVKLTSTMTPVYEIVVSAAQGSQTIKADEKVSFEELFSTSVLVIDAVAAGDEPVNGAHVKIFSEDGTELLYETTTGASGKFKVDLVGGRYAVKLTANNYEDYDDFMVVKSGADTNFKFALSPALGAEFGRIILQWSEAPNDLDAHLMVPPVGGGSRIHVLFNSKNPAGADASLDKDALMPPGVETITIRKGHKGTYTYFVKNYTMGNDAKLSTANVLLFLNKDLTLKSGTSRVTSFNAPDVVVSSRANWIVFDIIVDSNNEVQVVLKGTVSSIDPT